MYRARLASGWIAALLLAAGCGGEEVGTMKATPDPVVRKAYGGNRWFPGSAGELKTAVSGYIDEAVLPGAITGRLAGVISPHAGYVYSGKVAGYAFRALRDLAPSHRPQTVVILGFSHRGGFPGVAVMDGDILETPMGRAALDVEAREILVASSPRIRAHYAPHAGEHSAENQVPFVQSALPEAKLVVALIGDHDGETLDALVGALDGLAERRRIVVVASTDLLHDPDHDLVTRTDRETLAMIRTMDDAGLAKSWSFENQLCCGIGPVLAVMRFAQLQGCREGCVLQYRNSGDDHPESRGQWVVGYAAVAFAATPAGTK